MCLGAVLQSRISAIVYGAADPRLGAIDTSSYRTGLEKAYGYFPSVSAGLMADECSSLVSSFFRDLRKKKVKS
jgi:tRNA(adenine34) deaminase